MSKTVKQLVEEYKKDYSKYIGGRTEAHIKLADETINASHNPVFAFIGDYEQGEEANTAVVVCTPERMYIFHKKLVGSIEKTIQWKDINESINVKKGMTNSRVIVGGVAFKVHKDAASFIRDKLEDLRQNYSVMQGQKVMGTQNMGMQQPMMQQPMMQQQAMSPQQTELAKYQQMLQQGLITQAEYDQKRKEILGL